MTRAGRVAAFALAMGAAASCDRLATNIAGWLAGKRQRVGLQDADPQGSSTQWLSRRPGLFPSALHASCRIAGASGLGEFVMNEGRLRHLIGQVKSGKVSRRAFLRRMAAAGLTAPMATQRLSYEHSCTGDAEFVVSQLPSWP